MWYMAICRISPTTKKYNYMFFKSENPFSDYTYIGQGYEGAETGGSFVNIAGETVFVCGNDFKKRANYRLSFSKLTFPHGLFRGILLEQIYRSFKILNNETYHK